MNIEAYSSEDKDAILNLAIQAFEGLTVDQILENSIDLPSDKDWRYKLRTHLTEQMDTNPEQVLVAVIDHQIVGFMTHKFAAREDLRVGQVSYNAVHPDFQGRGIGSKLMEMTMETIRAAGCTFAYVMTTDMDIAAQGLYKKFGFSQTYSMLHFYQKLEIHHGPKMGAADQGHKDYSRTETPYAFKGDVYVP